MQTRSGVLVLVLLVVLVVCKKQAQPTDMTVSLESKISSTLFESRLHEKDKSRHYRCTFIVDIISISRTSIGRVLKRYLAALSKCSTYAEHLGSSKTLNSFHYDSTFFFGPNVFPTHHSCPHVLLKDFSTELQIFCTTHRAYPMAVSPGLEAGNQNQVLGRCIKYKDSRPSLL